MSQQNVDKTNNRFATCTFAEFQEANGNPIFGYEHVPVKSLEDAVKGVVHIVPKVEEYVNEAMENRKKNTHLTRDESASIYLYTMPVNFFEHLNKDLRCKNRKDLEPWFDFLNLFITALKKLPPCTISVIWRGVGDSLGEEFVGGTEHTWWSINSCSSNQNAARCFADFKGTLFSIHAINGKDISSYSKNPQEKEIVLMPGTRLRVKSAWSSALSTIVLEECTVIPTGQHIMLSYNINDKEIVFQIYDFLRNQEMPVWINRSENVTADSLHDSLANGVENAAAVFCFLTPDYERSPVCKLELQYAHKRRKLIIPCLFDDKKFWEDSSWLMSIVESVKDFIINEIQEMNKMYLENWISYLNKERSSSKHISTESVGPPNYLFELIKYKYLCDNKMERFMNPSKTFPIEQSYVNLAIVETKESQQKEKELRNTHSIDAILETYENIHGSKTPIDIKDIFQKCKDQNRKILVSGRAGIGKSTFCRYAAYQWATGAIWSEYELVVVVPLRSLVGPKYRHNKEYSFIDILMNQYFSDPSRSDEQKNKLVEKLVEQIRRSKILWLLDGYDEIAQDQPEHLQILLEQLLKTPHHIITSRPYMNTLSYSVQMEITGFTDENIRNYVKQFFSQLGHETQNSSEQDEKLLNFLKGNPKIWGIGHIPINLELICTIWGDTNWQESEIVTITRLYNKITVWLCRRYMKRGNKDIQIIDDHILRACGKPLQFLEILAFKGMENNNIILSPRLLKNVFTETDCSEPFANILNIGILKSSDGHKLTGTQIEVEKDHYFIHLSFQEYFAARYLLRTLKNEDQNQKKKAITLIQSLKYNQRFELVFTFLSGLLFDDNDQQSMNLFWRTLMEEPLDIVGFRHMQIVITCLEATGCDESIPYFDELIHSIIQRIEYHITAQYYGSNHLFLPLLKRSPSLVNQSEIVDLFIRLYDARNTYQRRTLYSFIRDLPISNACSEWIDFHSKVLIDGDLDLSENACRVFENMHPDALSAQVIDTLFKFSYGTSENIRYIPGDEYSNRYRHDSERQMHLEYNLRRTVRNVLMEIISRDKGNETINRIITRIHDMDAPLKIGTNALLRELGKIAATDEVIQKLLVLLDDKDWNVRESACWTLQKMGEKAATGEFIQKLLVLLDDNESRVRECASQTLEKMGEKAATNEVIQKLLDLLGDNNEYVRVSAYKALEKMGEKAATKEVVQKLLVLLDDKDWNVREFACWTLKEMGEKAATNEVIQKLLLLLGDKESRVREYACKTLAKMGEKAATNEVIQKLLVLLDDKDWNVREFACKTLEKMGEKAATNEVVQKLLVLLGDKESRVRESACRTLEKMDEKAATNEVVQKLLLLLGDEDRDVRECACQTLQKMGEKAATNEVVQKLLLLLGDKESRVREFACKTLEKMGEKAATNEVIQKLLVLLDDKHWYVKGSACKTLQKMGEKAATNEVIQKLSDLLCDNSEYSRECACKTLGKMGEKAATNEVIQKLLLLLGDKESRVRECTCKTLEKMGEKAATKEIIKMLLLLLGDTSRVAESACRTLKEMGEKTATNEVIQKLSDLLCDNSEYVRGRACKTLEKMGEKAATNEVIQKLSILLDDKERDVRRSACCTLQKMGEKAVTREVIQKLSILLCDKDKYVRLSARQTLAVIGEKAETDVIIKNLLILFHENEDAKVRLGAFESLAEIDHEYGMTVTDSTISVYGNKEPIRLEYDESELGDRLVEFFKDWEGYKWPKKNL
ncbi:unnamed protein product [Adineta ricciae]|uniref:NAD(P)(+)--arginine ADP-ribosyltransferase n=1 Tax=Adineta ricciae TaxID=249248 RepID=A0A815Y2P6_ADIRI|nr:unnamed protein product [Adineta ricciae]